MALNSLGILLRDQDAIEDRLLTGDRREHERVTDTLSRLDEDTILNHGGPLGRLYRWLDWDERARLRSVRCAWIVFEPSLSSRPW